jgi:hypothetical protein
MAALTAMKADQAADVLHGRIILIVQCVW